MAVVTDQAVAIGITAIPTPITDMGSDKWFVYELMGGRIDFDDATGVREVGSTHRFDSKAMRKVDIGEDLVVVLETDGSSSSLSINEGFRMLVKLH